MMAITTRLSAFALALIGAWAVCAPAAGANTFAVTTTADNGDDNNPPAGSLRSAVINANGLVGMDVIDATGVSGAIELEGPLRALTGDVEIRGPGPGKLTVRRGAGAGGFRILVVDDLAEEATISGLRLTGGVSMGPGGAVLADEVDLTIRDSVISGSAASSGGGVFLAEGDLTIEGAVIAGNRSGSGAAWSSSTATS